MFILKYSNLIYIFFYYFDWSYYIIKQYNLPSEIHFYVLISPIRHVVLNSKGRLQNEK